MSNVGAGAGGAACFEVGDQVVERITPDRHHEGAPFLQSGDDAAGGLGRFLADRLDDRVVRFLNDPQVNQRAGNRQLQAELLTHFPGELQDHICERRAIATVAARLLHGPREFLIDHALHPFQPSGR